MHTHLCKEAGQLYDSYLEVFLIGVSSESESDSRFTAFCVLVLLVNVPAAGTTTYLLARRCKGLNPHMIDNTQACSLYMLCHIRYLVVKT